MEPMTGYCIIAAFLILVVFFIIAFLDGTIDERTILATPNLPKDEATFTAFANVRINASANEVWDAVIGFQDYPRWHTVIKECTWEQTTADGAPFVRSKGSLRANMKGMKERAYPVECTLLDRERKLVAWRSLTAPLFLVHAEKVHEVVPIHGEKNVCDLRVWETVGGMLGLPMRYFLQGSFTEGCKRTTDDLKDYIENKKA